ncbi:unnamed protein product [Rotaria sp. Silwood1]|nr:unnamed protein product [Rotaria sp. Silwood1]CAF1237398.1 unnamed protein product [Rotaria sp. Silwood1]
MIGHEFDKVIKDMKELTISESVNEQNEVMGISGEDPLTEQKRQVAMENERKARQAKVEKEREEARQKIRDKYNIKKKDDLSSRAHGRTATTTLNENQAREANQASSFDPVKTATNAFDTLKKKLGWK